MKETNDKPRRRPRIRQTAPVVIDTTGPVTIRGVTAYDDQGNRIGQVGIETEADEEE